jgi:alkylation response protein AidB-like acyl-CoA dehydrogenase
VSDDDSAIIDELRAWLDAVELPAGLRDWGLTAASDDLVAAKAWQGMLRSAGFAGIGWPTEFGGRGVGPAVEASFIEELARRGLPRQISVGGPDVAGPIIMRHGTPEHRGLLSRILSGEHIWCQLWSEPDAGSDLANVRTRAVAADDGWRVSGQKVWASAAQIADYALLLARTGRDDPPQAGLTMFALPMDRPGITLAPIVQLDGEAKFNEVFLDDVPAYPADVLGQVDDGWRLLGAAVGRERLTVGAQAAALLRQITEYVEAARASGRWQDHVLRQRVVDCWSRATLLALTFRRILETSDGFGDPRMSMVKLYSTELQQHVAALAGDVHGVALVAGEHEKAANRLLAARSATIAGGTSEVQRNILGERVLGLPREPRT